MVIANIYLQKGLWNASNDLRGSVTENIYRNYTQPLVFIKQLSKRYEVVRDELQQQLKDPNSNYYTIGREEINNRFQY